MEDWVSLIIELAESLPVIRIIYTCYIRIEFTKLRHCGLDVLWGQCRLVLLTYYYVIIPG